MTYTIALLIKLGFAIIAAVILGNGCVVVFNRMPSVWFEDVDEDGGGRVLPDRLLKSIEEGRQRLPSTPWKFAFTAFFAACGIFLASRESLRYEVAVLAALTVVLLMAVSDYMYMIVPDQLSLILALAALGFIPFHDEWWEVLGGALVGLALSLAVWGLGKLIYKNETIGGADIKFYITMGLLVGRRGILLIFVMTTIIIAIQAAIRKNKMDKVPMLPAAFAATAVYLLFLWDYLDLIKM